MEKNVTLSTSGQVEVNLQVLSNSMQAAIRKLLFAALSPLEWLREYYSKVCERSLTMRQTVELIAVQLAFFATAFPADTSWLARIGCGICLVALLWHCKKFLS